MNRLTVVVATVVTAGMLADMQKATKPMTGEYIKDVGGASGAIIAGFLKDVGRN